MVPTPIVKGTLMGRTNDEVERTSSTPEASKSDEQWAHIHPDVRAHQLAKKAKKRELRELKQAQNKPSASSETQRCRKKKIDPLAEADYRLILANIERCEHR